LSPGARKQRIIHDKLRTKIRKLRKSLKLVADKKNIPRKRWQQQCGLLGGGGAAAAAAQLAIGRARARQSTFSLDSRVLPQTLISFSPWNPNSHLWLKL